MLHGDNKLGHSVVAMSSHLVAYCCHPHSVHLLCHILGVAFRLHWKLQEKLTLSSYFARL